MRYRSLIAVWSVCLGLSALGLVQAKTIRTEGGHFYVHYSSGARETAKEVALTAQEVYYQLVTAYQLHDKLMPIHILVTDNLDVGNGFADYYQNRVTIWATNLDYDLRGTHRWVRNVVTHELGHIFSLKVAARYPFRYGMIQASVLNQKQIDVGLNIPIYSMVTPSWWTEGIAQLEAYTAGRSDGNPDGYDTWDSNRDMLLRMATIEDDLLSFDEMGVFTHDWVHQEMVYNQGYSLSKFIADTYGIDKARGLAGETGRLTFNRAIKKTIGISLSALYFKWREELNNRYDELVRERGTVVEGEQIIDAGTYDASPSLSPDGSQLAYFSNKGEESLLIKLLIRNLETGRDQVVDERVYGDLSWSADGSKIVYTKFGRGTLFLDLYVYDLESEETRRISSQLRAKEPSFSPDGQWIVFVQNEDGANRLGMIRSDGSEIKWLTDNRRWPKGGKSASSGRVNTFHQFYGPRYSPDGEQIAFSVFGGEDRDIAVIGSKGPYFRLEATLEDSSAFPDSIAYPDSAGWRLLMHSIADERDPSWLPDGTGIVYSSDRNGIFDLYRLDIATGEKIRLTNVLGGAFSPDVSDDGKSVVYVGYHAGNFSIYQQKLPGIAEPIGDIVMVDRNYQEIPHQYSAGQLFDVGETRNPGFSLIGWAPYFRFGPQFFGDEFSVNQVGGGVEAAVSDALSSRSFSLDVSFSKNIKEKDKPSTNVFLVTQQSLGSVLTTSRSLAPMIYAYAGRSTINDVTDSYMGSTSDPITSVLFKGDTEFTNVNAISEQVYDLYSLSDADYRYLFGGAGIGASIGRGHRVGSELTLRSFSLRRGSGLEIKNSSTVIEGPTGGTGNAADQVVWPGGIDDVYEPDGTPSGSYIGTIEWPAGQAYGTRNTLSRDLPIWDVDYFKGSSALLYWAYGKGTPTVDAIINPQASRSISVAYRYWNVAVMDSLTESNEVTSDAGTPFWTPVNKNIQMNEFILSWREFIRNPRWRSHTLALSVTAGYRDQVVRSTDEPGVENALDAWAYWPLRYRLGGLGALRAYPYFAFEGSKMAFGRANYVFPLKRSVGDQLLFLYLDKVYLTIFAEAAIIWNRDDFRTHQINAEDFVARYPIYEQDTGNARWDFEPHRLGIDDVVADIGFELRFLTWTFYRLPMTAYVVWTRRLHDVPYPHANGLAHAWFNADGTRVPSSTPPPLDRQWLPIQPKRTRLYIGLTFGGFGGAGNRDSSRRQLKPRVPSATEAWWQPSSPSNSPLDFWGESPSQTDRLPAIAPGAALDAAERSQ